MKYLSYLNTTIQIIGLYKGQKPFGIFIKEFFKANKKYGSNDRKHISHLCYCYFRLGKAAPPNPPLMGGLSDEPLQIQEQILMSLFLCSDSPNEILKELKPEWNEKVGLTLEEKCSMFNADFSLLNIFPFTEELSEGIDISAFILSHLRQPDLFLRIRPGKEFLVERKLNEAGIVFKKFSDTCIALPNSTKVDKVLDLDKEAVVQDYSSQRVGRFLDYAIAPSRNDKLQIWDCCSGSGGKSILAYDLIPNIDLTVSDIRKSILINLKKRFSKAGIKNYKSFVTDLTHDSRLPTHDYDFIICDVPCTGSGTWGRTPEQLFFFKEEKIKEYASLQKQIVSNVIPFLKPGGCLLYIT
ncbi:MAG: Fmu (Sun) domain-containing protein, partial [Bacteroidota bacterium]|nr:Fmu (Sun) domain-containing protein [Bacteroidota bacterium]